MEAESESESESGSETVLFPRVRASRHQFNSSQVSKAIQKAQNVTDLYKGCLNSVPCALIRPLFLVQVADKLNGIGQFNAEARDVVTSGWAAAR